MLDSRAEVIPAMASISDWSVTNTEHGLLVAFGEFLQQHGLLDELMQVPIKQKMIRFAPQAKLIEFLTGIFSGIEYLSDLNDGPRPLAKDAIVAHAWSQPAFAHYSSISRTLEACDDQTVCAVQRAIDHFSQPFIQTAVHELLRAGLPLVYDLDLMGQAVSATSRTYPNATFGWMNDSVKLGYQLARVCLTTKTHERLWLSGFHHPGDTVSAACLQELIRAAEAQTGVRPRRRTDLLQQRIKACEQLLARPRRLLAEQQIKQTRLHATDQRLRAQIDQAEQRLKKPISKAQSARLRQQLQSWQARLPRLAPQLAACARVTAHHQTYLQQLRAEVTRLQAWRSELETDNRTNPNPPICEARMDSGFSGGAHLTWLIEMGYRVDTKAPSDKTTTALRAALPSDAAWTRVGDNAEMLLHPNYFLHDCPYPLTAALERFKVGTENKYATLLQYRDDSPCPPLPIWFHDYNGRQLIEAGNKELKSGVFHVQHLMSRAPAGIQLQVLFAGVAANSVHWAMPWLRECAAPLTAKMAQTFKSPKRVVRVAANSSALVQQTSTGTSLQFAPTSALPGVTLFLKGVPAFQLPLGFYQPCKIASDSLKETLVAQNLR